MTSDAKIVRLIFGLRAERYSFRKISTELERKNILSPTGNAQWIAATLDKLLSNKKYTGDVMLQKTFVEDFFTGVQIKNTGQRCKLLISNHHEANVEKKTGDSVQTMKMNSSSENHITESLK